MGKLFSLRDLARNFSLLIFVLLSLALKVKGPFIFYGWGVGGGGAVIWGGGT